MSKITFTERAFAEYLGNTFLHRHYALAVSG